ncbi:nuclear transport factor 2 family protein [Mycolicibacterium goodii]|uniref:Nuclear transport factor 2 family protein n=1 Tax=Mycolicibacterium goodii TaxID=134601 RepID=A0ABS6HXY7_MYCGD|nr:nuclear transport factor 2 family protein [Mycolicibacterium goodii]MBU8826312.1 nuclear transport factor 2 family protein [Mycolicibacterium goodii]MBU8839685.1 nuclear transport factor 2 family protein [Mycolicibacterium goodii]
MTTSQQHGGSESDNAAAIRAFISRWVTVGWHLERGEKFDFRRLLESYYDWDSADVLLHDNADPDRTLSRSAAEYATIWDTTLKKLVTLDNTVIDGPYVTVSGDLAVADVCFRSRFEFDNGDVDVVPTRSTLALRRRGEHWLIFREHGSALSPANGK